MVDIVRHWKEVVVDASPDQLSEWSGYKEAKKDGELGDTRKISSVLRGIHEEVERVMALIAEEKELDPLELRVIKRTNAQMNGDEDFIKFRERVNEAYELGILLLERINADAGYIFDYRFDEESFVADLLRFAKAVSDAGDPAMNELTSSDYFERRVEAKMDEIYEEAAHPSCTQEIARAEICREYWEKCPDDVENLRFFYQFAAQLCGDPLGRIWQVIALEIEGGEFSRADEAETKTERYKRRAGYFLTRLYSLIQGMEGLVITKKLTELG